MEDLKGQFQKELKVLEEMRPGASIDTEQQDEDPVTEKLWVETYPKIIKALKAIIKGRF